MNSCFSEVVIFHADFLERKISSHKITTKTSKFTKCHTNFQERNVSNALISENDRQYFWAFIVLSKKKGHLIIEKGH